MRREQPGSGMLPIPKRSCVVRLRRSACRRKLVTPRRSAVDHGLRRQLYRQVKQVAGAPAQDRPPAAPKTTGPPRSGWRNRRWRSRLGRASTGSELAVGPLTPSGGAVTALAGVNTVGRELGHEVPDRGDIIDVSRPLPPSATPLIPTGSRGCQVPARVARSLMFFAVAVVIAPYHRPLGLWPLVLYQRRSAIVSATRRWLTRARVRGADRPTSSAELPDASIGGLGWH
jgi:hypothetical protein